MKKTYFECPDCGSKYAICVEKIDNNKEPEGFKTEVSVAAVAVPSNSGKELRKSKAELRKEALIARGFDTDKLLTVDNPKGDSFLFRYDDNGIPRVVDDNDPILVDLFQSGFVPDKRLFRRWIAAMYAQANEQGNFVDWINRHGYEYSWRVTIEEFRVQSVLFKRDPECYYKRNRAFPNDTAFAIASDHIVNLKKAVEKAKVHKCKGVPYKAVPGFGNVFVSEIDSKVFKVLTTALKKIKDAKTPWDIYKSLSEFDRIKGHRRTGSMRISSKFIDSYKFAGSYYTISNFVRFSGMSLFDDNCNRLDMYSSLNLLEQKAEEYRGEGWRMHGLFKKFYSLNNICLAQLRKKWMADKIARK